MTQIVWRVDCVQKYSSGMQHRSDTSPAPTQAIFKPVMASGTFPGTPYPFLNASMWTIAYEFRCYLLVLGMGTAGALRQRWIAPVLGFAALASFELLPMSLLQQWVDRLPHHDIWLGGPEQCLRLTGVYLMGVSFFLYRDRISFTPGGGGYAPAALLIVGLFVPSLAHPAIATAGAYLIFGAALGRRHGLLTRINNRNDISYGVYLYAWPTTKLLIWFHPELPSWAVELLTFTIACALGWVSWHFLEKPVMRLLR